MKEVGICLMCGERFEREVKERRKLGCGDCGETPQEMARSMFLSARKEVESE